MCAPDVVDLRGPWGQAQFRIETADDAESRAQGLMHRESLPAMSGMLFLYDSPQPLVFWMRNTLIPLDLLFIDPNGEVLMVHERAIPLDESHIVGPDASIAVLEINGGMAQTLGIKAGSHIRHSFFDGISSSWPCEAS
jgi:uncharacterized membrane protein (UPF0127 family)